MLYFSVCATARTNYVLTAGPALQRWEIALAGFRHRPDVEHRLPVTHPHGQRFTIARRSLGATLVLVKGVTSHSWGLPFVMKTRGVVLLAYALRTAAADDRATHELTVAGERRLALPIVNSSGAMNLMGQGRMEYTYLSPRPFNFREHDNPWILLCGDIEIYDLSSSDLTAAFLHFDPATWKDDALRYPGTVPEVHGSYDERSRTMTLEATGGELCGNQNFTARSY